MSPLTNVTLEPLSKSVTLGSQLPTPLKLLGCLLVLLAGCAQESTQEQQTPTTQEMVNFRIEQLEADPAWVLKGKRAKESTPGQFNIEELPLQLQTQPSPLQITSQQGLYQAQELILETPVELNYSPFQGVLSSLIWQEYTGFTGRNLVLKSPTVMIKAQQVNTAPPYKQLTLAQVQARFEY